jgi:hypothetical protein
MKVLQFKNTAGTIVVDYLTDLVGTNENFTIYQVNQWVNGVKVALTDAAIALGFPHNLQEHNLQDFVNLAENKAYTLTSYENTAGGSTSTVLWGGSYGDGGAIGEDEL